MLKYRKSRGKLVYLLFCKAKAMNVMLGMWSIGLIMKKLLANIIRACIVAAGKLPLKFHYFMGDILSWFAEKVLRYRSDVVWINISRSFPQMKYKELKKVYKDFYRHLGEIVAEAIWFGGSDYKRIHDKEIVVITNPEEINDYFLSTPSMTVLSTHCGNWELMGGFLGYKTVGDVKVAIEEEHITVVYKKLSSDVADDVFKRNRVAVLERVGTSCEVESSNVLRFAMKHKDERRVYIYPTDQAPYKKAGKHPIGKFMHQETNVMLGSVGVACKFAHSVMYMTMKRTERGRYEIALIPICRDASKVTPEEIMRKYYDLLQDEINETPHNWLWSHKRWK